MKLRYFFFILLCLLVSANMLAQTCGTTNIALTKTATSSPPRDYSAAPNVVDASTSTNWKSVEAGTQWLMVDLGQVYSICNIKIKWAADFYYASAFTVYVSNSGALGSGESVLSPTGSTANEHNISLANPKSGRYVRIEMTAPGVSWADHYEVVELEVYAGTGNLAPTTSITLPSANATFTYGTNVVIKATATDGDGDVTLVEFYEGSNKLGDADTAPYEFTWINPPAGTHVLTAKAIDDDNGEGTSQQVTITISNPPASSGWSLTGNSGIDSTVNFMGTKNAAALVIKTKDQERMRILSNGQVLINGINPPHADAALAVNGFIYARKLTVTQGNWSDYVFDTAYRLRSLQEVEKFIATNKHLPDVPSAKEIETTGLNVGDQHAVILRKVEELTLYVIQQQKEIDALKKELDARGKKRACKQ
jgi:hypothetical protein